MMMRKTKMKMRKMRKIPLLMRPSTPLPMPTYLPSLSQGPSKIPRSILNPASGRRHAWRNLRLTREMGLGRLSNFHLVNRLLAPSGT